MANAPSSNWLSRIVGVLSGESLLKKRKTANGGAIVVRRAVRTTVVLYVLGLVMLNAANGLARVCSGEDTHASFGILFSQVAETLPWVGALAAVTWASLHSKFTSQWSYLAQMYNDIKAAEVGGVTNKEALEEWKCAFVHDAHSLHLLFKTPSVAEPAYYWLRSNGVRRVFDQQDRIAATALLNDLAEVLEVDSFSPERAAGGGGQGGASTVGAELAGEASGTRRTR